MKSLLKHRTLRPINKLRLPRPNGILQPALSVVIPDRAHAKVRGPTLLDALRHAADGLVIRQAYIAVGEVGVAVALEGQRLAVVVDIIVI